MKSFLLSAALLAAFAANAQTPPVTAAAVAADYSKLVYASYEDTLTTAQAHQTAYDRSVRQQELGAHVIMRKGHGDQIGVRGRADKV